MLRHVAKKWVLGAAVVLTVVAAVVMYVGGQLQGSAQDLPINVGLPERELVIERAGETIAEFTVEIADTPETQRIGLMGRTELAPDRGMLFILGTAVLRIDVDEKYAHPTRLHFRAGRRPYRLDRAQRAAVSSRRGLSRLWLACAGDAGAGSGRWPSSRTRFAHR